MQKLSTGMIARLRDSLREGGQRPSMVSSGAYETLARAGLLAPEEEAAVVRIEPLIEAMFLVMAADGELTDSEREVLRGAVRGLTDDGVRSGTVAVMLERFARQLSTEGAQARLEAIAADLEGDRASAEGAFVLAAATAFADDQVTDAEEALVNALAHALDLDEARANQLLDQLDAG